MSVGSKGESVANLSVKVPKAPDVGYRISDGTFPSWLAARNVRIFTFSPYMLLMKKVMK